MTGQKSPGIWGVFEQEDEVHVSPIDDWIEHVLSEECICQPQKEIGVKNLIIHEAIDGRE